MADNDELMKALNAALTRIGSLEQELRTKPKDTFDPQKHRQQLFLNPIATMRAMGATEEVIETARAQFLVDKLGDTAPLHMRIAASSGSQVMAAQETQQAIAALRQQVADMQAESQMGSKRQSLKAIADMKDKYPNLSKAFSVDEATIVEALKSHGGSVEDFAKAQEAKWTPYFGLQAAPLETAPAGSVENPDNKDQSKKVELAKPPGGNAKPPVDEKKPSGWDEAQHKAAIERIVAKLSAPKS